MTPDPDGGFRRQREVVVPPNALHALEGHGVIDALDTLEFAFGRVAPGVDAVLHPAALDAAASIFYGADRKTYGATWEFSVATQAGCPPRELRIVIDNRGYQRTLCQLQFLVTSAGRRGLGVWLRL